MNVELINTGSELMLGRVLNTHQQWLCRRLADLGLVVTRQVAVPDTGPAIRDAVREGLQRAQLVVTTGGLGPTSDDITRDLVAEMLGLKLHEDPGALANIERFFAARKRPMPERVRVQAMVPEGGVVLANAHGTAPGLAIHVAAGQVGPHAAWLIMLPGPPRELRPMFDDVVRPLLKERLEGVEPFHCVTLRTCGLGESWVEERLVPILPPLQARGLDIGYCARTGEVDVRLTAVGAAGGEVVREAEQTVRGLLAENIFGCGDELLEAVVVRLATERRAPLAVAESCTGGYLAHRLTNVPGASAVFWGGWLTYDNRAKQRELGVSEALLQSAGAVSEACASAMAEGGLRESSADHVLAVTGIAGPSGGTADKPVGTVFVALASRGQPTLVRKFFNPFDRETFKYVTSQQALEMLRRRLLEAPRGS